MAVYGHGEDQAFDEKQTPCPIDPYGVANMLVRWILKLLESNMG